MTSMILIATVVFLTACGGFNPKTAEEESGKALDNFFSSHKELEILVESSNVNEVSNFVEKEFKAFLTKDFMKKVEEKIMANDNKKSKFTDPELFFIEEGYDNKSKEYSTIFFNAYEISFDQLNEDRQAVTFKIRPTEAGLLKNGGLIEMCLEDGDWKINSIQQ